MARGIAHDLGYLAARLHGRRARLAEAERLDALCQLRTVPELARAAGAGADDGACAAFQRRVVQDLVLELSFAAASLAGAGAALLATMQARYQVENIKVVLRAFLNHVPLERAQRNLLLVSQALSLDVAGLLTAATLEELVELLPAGAPRSALQSALQTWGDPPRLFFLEAALDRGHLEELLERAARLGGDDREVVVPLFDQEACAFELLLVLRGRFLHGLPPEALLPLNVQRSSLSGGRFKAMCAAPDLRTAASSALGRAIDALPAASEPRETPVAVAELEALAWERHFRLSNRAFRRSHMGLGAVIGYFGVRQVEAQNLVTLSEGVRAGLAPELIRARLIPRPVRQVARA